MQWAGSPLLIDQIIEEKMKLLLTLFFMIVTSYSLWAQTKEVNGEPDNTVYTVVEQMPEYFGGTRKLLADLSKNLVYPKEARKLGIEGIVHVQFIIHKDGTVSDIEVVKGVSDHLDNGAVSTLKALGPWIPGKQRGKAVNVKYVLPITFKLDK
jgi:TonB family protein